jgi:hypothetical protein
LNERGNHVVKIHNALKEGKDFYEAVCGNWKIDKRRFVYIQYVVGINQGIVFVLQVSKWHIIEKDSEKGNNTSRVVILREKCYQNCNVQKSN